MPNPNCRRCRGTGEYEMQGDMHRSAGVVPCNCPPNMIGPFGQKDGKVRAKSTNFEDVQDFHAKFNQLAPDGPTHLTKRKLAERANFMLEELREFASAAGLQLCSLCDGEEFEFLNITNDDQDLPLQADALVDLVYVALGTAAMMGLPWQELWDDVQRANMAKEMRIVTHRVGSQHPKAMIGKPDGWVGPRTAEILDEAGYIREDFVGRDGTIADVLCLDDKED